MATQIQIVSINHAGVETRRMVYGPVSAGNVCRYAGNGICEAENGDTVFESRRITGTTDIIFTRYIVEDGRFVMVGDEIRRCPNKISMLGILGNIGSWLGFYAGATHGYST